MLNPVSNTQIMFSNYVCVLTVCTVVVKVPDSISKRSPQSSRSNYTTSKILSAYACSITLVRRYEMIDRPRTRCQLCTSNPCPVLRCWNTLYSVGNKVNILSSMVAPAITLAPQSAFSILHLIFSRLRSKGLPGSRLAQLSEHFSQHLPGYILRRRSEWIASTTL